MDYFTPLLSEEWHKIPLVSIPYKKVFRHALVCFFTLVHRLVNMDDSFVRIILNIYVATGLSIWEYGLNHAMTEVCLKVWRDGSAVRT